MNKKEMNAIKTVYGMMNSESFTEKEELLNSVKELGWKPVTLNFAISKLKKSGVIVEENKSFKIIKELKLGETMERTTYKTKKANYRKEIKELTPEQEEFKELVNDNRDELFGKKITWVDENGMTFPLTIAGMGDVTLRCRFFLSKFMKSEPQTGALVYIPWDEPNISQLFDQVEALLEPKEEVQECVNFAQMIPAK